MQHQVQELVDQIWEDTCSQSNPRMWMEHPAMAELLALPKNIVTPILLDMLRHDPNRILISALRMFHGDEGPTWPKDDNGRLNRICEHWIRWEAARRVGVRPDDR